MLVETLVLTEYQANCYIVESQGEAMVIDPGEPSPRILERLAGRRVLYILSTHAHPDHIQGNGYLKEQLGASIVLHQADVGLFRAILGETVQPDRLIEEDDVITVGALRFEVLHTPGHTPGSVTLLERGERALFTGDLLFAGSIGRTDFPGGSDIEMRQSLVKIGKLEGDWRIYPGHGPETTLDHERRTNPFLLALI
jgi:glyoxylase-like metal-dependent hydrolase (beta-lactamase superfamily II)